MRNSVALACVLVLVGGCRPPEELSPPTRGPFGTPPSATGTYIDPRAEANVQATHAPPPISGGTLAVTHDGLHIVASDPDRDRVVIVAVTSSGAAVGAPVSVHLPDGAEPGRVVIDEANHLAHVVLRGTGEIASINLVGAPTITRRAACSAPRGIAMDVRHSLVRVACRDGEIVSFDPSAANAPSVMETSIDDLRDIIVRGDELVVTRFRSAQLVRLNASTGALVGGTVQPVSSTSPTTVRADGQPAQFQPSVAWRAIVVGSDILVAHQRSSDGELRTAPGAYYSTGVCSGSIVQSAATLFRGADLTPAASPNIAGATLPVDIAVSPNGMEYAVVGAGIESTAFHQSVSRLQASAVAGGSVGYGAGYGGCINQGYGYGSGSSGNTGAEFTPNAIAVAYLPGGDLVVQGRDPSVIRIGSRTIELLENDGREPLRVFDTGHAFFHGDAGRGTACASCHPEGGDDGRTWVFNGMGQRRTPTIPAGFLNTAPFHWSGDLPDLGHLMGTVFTERMGGPAVNAGQTAAVGNWLDTRQTDTPRIANPDAAARGAVIFEEAGCSSCHSGAMLTNNQTVDVGTGGAFQVPSLVGVSRALPLMHTGCATTLEQRFRPDCGGSSHGTITSMADPRIPDLVAYLRTL